MLELTVSHGNGNLILGVMNRAIKYKINGEGPLNSNPFDEERIVCFSADEEGKSNISNVPLKDYYPIIIRHNNEGQYTPGKIVNIKELA